MRAIKEGALKRIMLLATTLILTAIMISLSALSVTALGQDQYSSTTGQAAVCAPWSKDWDISKGRWWFQWYRWCYDPSTSDPAYEASWYKDLSTWEWGDQVNLCPESGTCTVSTGGGGVVNQQVTTS